MKGRHQNWKLELVCAGATGVLIRNGHSSRSRSGLEGASREPPRSQDVACLTNMGSQGLGDWLVLPVAVDRDTPCCGDSFTEIKYPHNTVQPFTVHLVVSVCSQSSAAVAAVHLRTSSSPSKGGLHPSATAPLTPASPALGSHKPFVCRDLPIPHI